MKTTPRRAALRSAALCAALLAGAASSAAAATSSATDALGRTVSFDRDPARIVVCGRATVLLLDAVYLFRGIAARVVGVGVSNQGLGDVLPLLDPGWQSKARLANDAGAEQVAGLKPDLVVLKTSMKGPLGDALERLGIPVFYLDLESPESFRRDVRSLGDLFRQRDRAREVVEWYDRRIAAVARGVAGAPRPRVLLLSATGADAGISFSIPPAGWIQTWMVDAAGGDPVWRGANVGSGWSKVGLEQAAAWKPERVFVVSYQSPAEPAAERLRSGAFLSAAVRAFPADFVSWDQSDARWILGLQWTAAALHPDRFPGFDLAAEVLSFYRDLYGTDERTVRSQVLPRLSAAAP